VSDAKKQGAVHTLFFLSSAGLSAAGIVLFDPRLPGSDPFPLLSESCLFLVILLFPYSLFDQNIIFNIFSPFFHKKSS
jgi:hypothetical protein